MQEKQLTKLLKQQLLAKVDSPQTGISLSAVSLASTAVNFITQYHQTKRNMSLTNPIKNLKEKKSQDISNFFRLGGKEHWINMRNKFMSLIDKIFNNSIHLKQEPYWELSSDQKLQVFAKRILTLISEHRKQLLKSIQSLPCQISSNSVSWPDFIKEVVSSDRFIKDNEELINLLTNIREQVFEGGKNMPQTLELVEFTCILVWKKTQIVLIKQWMAIFWSFIQKVIGYHEELPNFFKGFNLSSETFDSRGNLKYPNKQIPRVSFRGKVPYFQPINGLRLGINLKHNYGDESWLASDDREGQWAVAFYSANIRNPSSLRQGTNISVLEWLMMRRYQKEMLSLDYTQTFKQSKSLNKPQQIIGQGISCSPLFTYCLTEETELCTMKEQKYRVVMQCRVRPESIKCVPDKPIWVINKLQDIRPYALILFTEQQTNLIKKLTLARNKQFYGIPFNWQSWSVQYSKWKGLKPLQSDIQSFLNMSLPQVIADKDSAKQMKTLNLVSIKTNQKLRIEGMKELSKTQLPNVETINIKNNDIRDEGIDILCSNLSFQNLKQIQLNNNSLSVVGVSHLVNNKWSDQVNYKLDTVKTSDQGYAFKVGQNIKNIRKIIDHTVSHLNYEQIGKLQSTNSVQLYQALDLLMQTPIEGNPAKIAAESKQLLQKFQQTGQDNPSSIDNVFVSLNSIYGQQGNVVFSKRSTARSQVTCNLALCGSSYQRIKFRHRLEDDRWKFQDFENNNDKLVKFQQFYKELLAKQYGANKQDVILHKVTKGSSKAWASVNHDNFLVKNSQFTKTQDIKVMPFFESFNLSPEDFDSKGNYTFEPNNQTSAQSRAGIPYFQPVYGTRFGFSISKKYDGGDDAWLSMNGVPGQWAVAFHGTGNPGNHVASKNMTVLQSMVSGKQKGQMLIAGAGQAYSSSIAVNSKSKQLVGKGIYLSPCFTTCLMSYTSPCTRGSQTYRVLLQCRIKPQTLKCTQCDDYWVVNESKHIRPYGIVLFTQEQYKKINSLKGSPGFYPQGFKYSSWKEKYQTFRQKHNLPF